MATRWASTRRRTAARQEAASRQYIQSVTASSTADQIAKLADLKASGAITEAEYTELKAKALAG